MGIANPEDGLSRLVTTALREYVETRKRLAFEEAMAAMAADPAIRRASTELMAAFRTTESDGLPPYAAISARPIATQTGQSFRRFVGSMMGSRPGSASVWDANKGESNKGDASRFEFVQRTWP